MDGLGAADSRQMDLYLADAQGGAADRMFEHFKVQRPGPVGEGNQETDHRRAMRPLTGVRRPLVRCVPLLRLDLVPERFYTCRIRRSPITPVSTQGYSSGRFDWHSSARECWQRIQGEERPARKMAKRASRFARAQAGMWQSTAWLWRGHLTMAVAGACPTGSLVWCRQQSRCTGAEAASPRHLRLASALATARPGQTSTQEGSAALLALWGTARNPSPVNR